MIKEQMPTQRTSADAKNKCRRFSLLTYPLEVYNESEELHRDDYRIQGKSYNKPLYPIRAMTYWYSTFVIRAERIRLNRPLVIADIGCERGLLKRFVPAHAPSSIVGKDYWIGLDLRLEETASLASYDEYNLCDFDKVLPVKDAAVDVVAFINVLEHLPRPEFTLAEIKRILKPGGVVILIHPVYPKLVAIIRQRQYAAEIARGIRKYGDHTVAFWPDRSRKLAQHMGFTVEFMASTYLLSWSEGPLENYKWWIRLNQLWGALFPSLGQEFCMQLRLN
jgi:SAM-dependent methyltransferase